ncbi:MAG: EscU/YscU/HrcU family type III secretion system export apparatus switch protein [Pseudomonadota bacterium]
MPEGDAHDEPIRVAAALRYDDAAGGAPRVTASGHEAVAEQIVALAKDAGVPHYQDPHLARLLAQVDLGEEIPPALYQAVAEVIAFVWSLSDGEDDPTVVP